MSKRILPLKAAPSRKEVKVAGEKLLEKAKQLAREGNVRRIIIKNAQGRVVLEVPLNAGVVGAMLRPTWVAIGAIGALASRHTLVVERK